MSRLVTASDLFCGAGGSSTGLVHAATALGMRLQLLAINHWDIAVQTHKLNHPWAEHLCADLSQVDPSKVVPSGKLDILIASPECTHHSNARGGKPCSDQSRASAWHVLHWAERLRIDRILIENVREFQNWGPLNRNGRPNKKRKGATFTAFLAALESLGYAVDKRVLNAADFGDATCRQRLFIQASRTGKIIWPEPTHAGHWRAAREVIDWDLRGQSIFDRKRPLAPRTLDRIEAGLKKFGGEPFIAVLRGTHQSQSGSWAKSVEDPLGTISAGGVHAAVCEPFVIGQQSGSVAREVSEPLPTIATKGAVALCQPFILGQHSGNPPRSTEKPMPAVCCNSRGIALIQPFIVTMEHSGRQPVRSTEKPLPTITTAKGGSFGVCQPFLTKYYGAGKGARPVTQPLDTVTAKDRFALVEPRGMDILFRMLQPHELAAAMGFDGYQFAGTKTDQVRQIGNAVAVRTAQALCGEILKVA